MPDSVVIELVKRQIALHEKEGHTWILEGFPRTQVQALALQEMGIVPDKIIKLDVKPAVSVARIKKNLLDANSPLYGPELDEVAE